MSVPRAPEERTFHVAFEGPMAAGKTTHAQLLADAYKGTALLERFATNEFLADFYDERERWALPMQVSFLLSRHRQMEEMGRRPPRLVADYGPGKDRLFAGVLLEGRERRLYEELAATLTTKWAQPDVIVYLDATDSVLLERIRERGRPYEMSIDRTYLGRVRTAYEEWLSVTCPSPILRVDTGTIDLSGPTDVTRLHTNIMELFDQVPHRIKDEHI